MNDNVEVNQTPMVKEKFGKKQFLEKLEVRFFRTANYLSIYLYILIVYGGALITDYLLFGLMFWLLRDDIRDYLYVAMWFNYARIGLALLFIIAAVIHGAITTWGQIKLDLALAKESNG